MNKRKLATLIAASFAGLMLSSPSFATDANKAQSTSGGSTSAQTPTTASGAPESRSIERADKKAAESDASRNTEMKDQTASDKAASSEKADADAKADYRAAVEKCDALPTDQRNTCIQDAEAAQTLAMEKSRDGKPATSGAPESRVPGQQSAK
jgi:hypothetical protein